MMRSQIVNSLSLAMPVILASASPRRRELLQAAGVNHDVWPVDVDERRAPGEDPAAYVARVARLKAEAGAARQPDRIVLAADTAVVVDDEVLGKPAGDDDATRMLRLLSGRAHEVLTGVAAAFGGRMIVEVETTRVWVSSLSVEDIVEYVRSGEPRDKAGAYAIQGLASRFVTRIEGSYTNVVGLPMHTVCRILKIFDRIIED